MSTHIDVILDLETLSNKPNAAILQIGAVAINADLNYISHIDLRIGFTETRNNALSYDLDIDELTCKWWNSQPNRDQVFVGNDMSYREALIDFNIWLNQLVDDKQKIRVWGRGTDFDCIILRESMIKYNITPNWMYYNNRCLRTLNDVAGIDTLTLERLASEEAHTAIGDARYQSRLFILAKGILTGKGKSNVL